MRRHTPDELPRRLRTSTQQHRAGTENAQRGSVHTAAPGGHRERPKRQRPHSSAGQAQRTPKEAASTQQRRAGTENAQRGSGLKVPKFDENHKPTGLPCGSNSKESACNEGDPRSIPGSERSPGEGNGYPLQYSCLQNPMDTGPGKQQSIQSQRVRRVSNSHFHLQKPTDGRSSKNSKHKHAITPGQNIIKLLKTNFKIMS